MNRAVASGALSWGTATGQGPTMVSFAGPSASSSSGTEIQLQDFSVGLVRQARPAGVSSGSARRSRAAGTGSGSVPEACSVEGCRSDLSRCREYHRRHKVCEVHAKTPVVVVGGREQRFCQQCSRFHVLYEFDEGKRSCRKRLDCHNRRRRKPQHDIMNLGAFFPYYQVAQQSTPRLGQNSESTELAKHQEDFSISFSETFDETKQFPFSQEGGIMLDTFRPTNPLAEYDNHTRSSSLSGTLAPSSLSSVIVTASSFTDPRPSRGDLLTYYPRSRIGTCNNSCRCCLCIRYCSQCVCS